MPIIKSIVERLKSVFHISVTRDDAANCWVAESDDVPGFVTGAETLDALIEKAKTIIPELLELNNVAHAGPVIEFEVTVRSATTASLPA